MEATTHKKKPSEVKGGSIHDKNAVSQRFSQTQKGFAAIAKIST